MVMNLLVGILAGLIITLPVGAVGVVCIKQTLQKGFKSGYITSLGATVADTIFAVIASIGVSVFISFIDTHRTLLEVSGGLLIIIMGLFCLLNREKSVKMRHRDTTYRENLLGISSTFFITISNPLIIFFLLAFFAKLQVSYAANSLPYHLMIALDVMIGSTTAYWFIAYITHRNKSRLTAKHLRQSNKICGMVLSGIGIFLIFKHFFIG